jgi:MFS family permease
LVVISLGVSLIIVDTTIVNVAIPSIINDLGITGTQAQWVQEIYTLIFGALPVRATSGLRVGCRRLRSRQRTRSYGDQR